MSWSSKKIFGLVAGATIATVVAGCAGSDSSIGPNPGTPSIPVTGGVPQDRGTSDNAYGATSSPQQVQVTTSTGPTSGLLPAGLSLNAGEQVGTISPNQAIISGLTVNQGGRQAPPGEIYVTRLPNTTQNDTGIHINNDGSLSGRLVLPNGHYRVFIAGPLAIVRGGGRLDMQSMTIDGWVQNGWVSIPATIDGDIPVNGGSSYPLAVDITMPGEFATGQVELMITHANGVLDQKRTLNAGAAQFHDFVVGSNSAIPTVGVQNVEFDWRPLVP